MNMRPPISHSPTPLCPYTHLFRSDRQPRFDPAHDEVDGIRELTEKLRTPPPRHHPDELVRQADPQRQPDQQREPRGEAERERDHHAEDREHAKSEEHTSELQSLMRISYAVFCLKKKKQREHT